MSVAIRQQPAYPLHKTTGQARVVIDGKHLYLGRFNSPASRERYDDLIAEWRIRNVDTDRYTLTVDDLALSYLEHAKQHYLKDGKETSEVCCVRNALRSLIDECGHTRAREFGPRLLKSVRDRMVQARLCRSTINKNIGRIRRMFRWAVAEELVPATVLTALQAVQGLQAGRCAAVEPMRSNQFHAMPLTRFSHLSAHQCGRWFNSNCSPECGVAKCCRCVAAI